MPTLDKRQKDLLGVLLIIFSLFVVAAGGTAYYYLSKQNYNEDTLCPDLPEQQRISIIIDRTDSFTNSENVRNRVLFARDELDVYGRLLIFVVNEDGIAPTTPAFDLCNPGRGKDVSPLYRNPKRVEARFLEQFSAPLDLILTELLKPGKAPQSPITQSLVNVLAFDTVSKNPSVHEILLISDLLENSEIMNAYSPELKIESSVFQGLVFEKFGKSTISGNVSAMLDVVWRKNMFRRQQRLLSNYWVSGLELVGVAASYTSSEF